MERIYGIREGSANPKGTEVGTSSSNGTSREMTQQDLAAQFGVDINTLKRAKSLTALPVEIQELGTMQNLISHFLLKNTVCLRVSESEMYQLFLHSSLVEQGKISPSTASRLIAMLNE